VRDAACIALNFVRLEGTSPYFEAFACALARGSLARRLEVRFRLADGSLSWQQRQESSLGETQRKVTRHQGGTQGFGSGTNGRAQARTQKYQRGQATSYPRRLLLEITLQKLI
jgi:hypothetical protein